jgi:hypothetical protein
MSFIFFTFSLTFYLHLNTIQLSYYGKLASSYVCNNGESFVLFYNAVSIFKPRLTRQWEAPMEAPVLHE